MKNKLNNLYEDFSLSKIDKFKSILNKGETSKEDLLFLGECLGIKKLKIDWAHNYDAVKNRNTPYILNIGDGIGSHWVAAYKGFYFDSYGLPPDSDIKNYEKLVYNTKKIQHSSREFCGQYSIFYLYSMVKGKKSFYDLFNKIDDEEDFSIIY